MVSRRHPWVKPTSASRTNSETCGTSHTYKLPHMINQSVGLPCGYPHDIEMIDFRSRVCPSGARSRNFAFLVNFSVRFFGRFAIYKIEAQAALRGDGTNAAASLYETTTWPKNKNLRGLFRGMPNPGSRRRCVVASLDSRPQRTRMRPAHLHAQVLLSSTSPKTNKRHGRNR